MKLTKEQIAIIKEEAGKIKDSYPPHVTGTVINTIINTVKFYGNQSQISEILEYLEGISECSKLLKERIQEKVFKRIQWTDPYKGVLTGYIREENNGIMVAIRDGTVETYLVTHEEIELL